MERTGLAAGDSCWLLEGQTDILHNSTPAKRREVPKSGAAAYFRNKAGEYLSIPASKDVKLHREGVNECEEHRVRGLLKNCTAEKSCKSEDEQYISENLNAGKLAGLHNRKSTLDTAELSNIDFYSPRELTGSSMHKATPVTHNRLLCCEGERADVEVDCGVKGSMRENSFEEGITEGPNFVLSRQHHETKQFPYIENAKCTSKTILRQTLFTEEKKNHYSVESSTLTSSSSSPTQHQEEQPLVAVGRGGNQFSTLQDVAGTRGGQLGDNALTQSLGDSQSVPTPFRHYPRGNATSSAGRVLPSRGSRGAGALNATVHLDEHRQFSVCDTSPVEQPRCSLGNSACAGSTFMAQDPPSTGASPLVSDASWDESKYSSTSNDEQSRTSSNSDGLSWVDYPCKGRLVDAARKKGRHIESTCSCHNRKDTVWSNSSAQLLKERHEKLFGRILTESFSSKKLNRSAAHAKTSGLTHRDRLVEDTQSPKRESSHLAHDNEERPHRYFSKSEHVDSLRDASGWGCLADSERIQRKRNNWTSTLREKAHLIRCKSDSFRAGSRKFSARQVKHTLRLRMGDVVSRLKPKRKAIFGNQQPFLCFHGVRATPSGSTNQTEKACLKETQQLYDHDSPRNDGKQIGENLPLSGDAKYSDVCLESSTRRNEPTEAEAAPEEKESLRKEEDGRPPFRSAAFVRASAERVELLDQRQLASRSVQTKESLRMNDNTSNARSQPLARPCTNTTNAKQAGYCPTRSQSGGSHENPCQLMYTDPSYADIAHRKSAVCHVKPFESCRRPITTRSPEMKPQPRALESWGARSMERSSSKESNKKCFDSVFERRNATGCLSRGLSEVMTQASTERLQICFDTCEHRGIDYCDKCSQRTNETLHAESVQSFSGSSTAALASIKRSQSLHSDKVMEYRQQSDAENCALTMRDVEASIDWIVEASSDPQLLKAARELLGRKHEAERGRRVTSPSCHNCGDGLLPTYYAHRCSWCQRGIGNYSRVNANLSKELPEITPQKLQSLFSSTSSRPSSINHQTLKATKTRTEKDGRRSDAHHEMSWTSHGAMAARVRGRSTCMTGIEEEWTKRIHSKGAGQSQRHSQQNRGGQLRTIVQDDTTKDTICYASLDIAWNTDQVI